MQDGEASIAPAPNRADTMMRMESAYALAEARAREDEIVVEAA